MLSMTERVTILGLSRWSERGGSYRTLLRWFHSKLNWAELHWLLVREHLLVEEQEWILAGDEVVVSKSGKNTSGLDRFFSSLRGKAIPGLCFMGLLLISVKQRRSYPLCLEPIVKEAADSCPKVAKAQIWCEVRLPPLTSSFSQNDPT